MGDLAESAFLVCHPQAHVLGLRRPSLNFRKMHARIRYTPDFLLEDGAYEVMGYASRGNNVLKLKLDKLAALCQWDLVIPTNLWVYDSSTKTPCCAPINSWAEACHDHGEIKRFKDNSKAYWELRPEHFPNWERP
jgi:hypothetical protein